MPQTSMKILLVADQFYAANNGMTISARRFAQVIRQHGHEVRVLCFGKPEFLASGERAYLLKKQYIPIFDDLISSQGMTFAKVDKAVIREAVEWAEIIHYLTPFALTHAAIRVARQMGKPYTAAFHVQPENITSSIHLGKVGWINTAIYHWFHFYVYRYCTHIHCPSNFIAGELRRTGYEAQLHVVSNGIDPDFQYRKLPKTDEFSGKFLILMTGRLSIEKRQDVLVEAVAQSKHKDEIHLVLAGKGPRKEKILAEEAGRFAHQPVLPQAGTSGPDRHGGPVRPCGGYGDRGHVLHGGLRRWSGAGDRQQPQIRNAPVCYGRAEPVPGRGQRRIGGENRLLDGASGGAGGNGTGLRPVGAEIRPGRLRDRRRGHVPEGHGGSPWMKKCRCPWRSGSRPTGSR